MRTIYLSVLALKDFSYYFLCNNLWSDFCFLSNKNIVYSWKWTHEVRNGENKRINRGNFSFFTLITPTFYKNIPVRTIINIIKGFRSKKQGNIFKFITHILQLTWRDYELRCSKKLSNLEWSVSSEFFVLWKVFDISLILRLERCFFLIWNHGF